MQRFYNFVTLLPSWRLKILYSLLIPNLIPGLSDLCFQFIPMPVLYGVFLYMGVSSLQGIQVLHGSAQTMSSHCELTSPD